MKITVATHRGGSRCVVSWGSRWNNTYIEDRIDVRQPEASFIEVVRNGRRIYSTCCNTADAPKTIVKHMKRCMV